MLLALVSCGQKAAVDAKPPFGAFDIPRDGERLKGIAIAMGWALAEGGVEHVDLYLDHQFLQRANLKIKRPDVLKLYPAFAKVEDVGWVTELLTESLPIGQHEFVVRVTSRKGAVADLDPHRVTIEH